MATPSTAGQISPALQSYLSNCSPQQAAAIIDALNTAALAPLSQQNMSAAGTLTHAKTGAKKRSKSEKRKRVLQMGGVVAGAAAKLGPKRPLNSFFAFRSYYSPPLSPATQKLISMMIQEFWHHEPFKAKWAILAKAYSLVRGDLEKAKAPLDVFLDLCAPMVKVIPRNEYLETMGYKLVVDNNGLADLTRFKPYPALASWSEDMLSTSWSAEDLMRHCVDSGYLMFAAQDDTNDDSNQGGLNKSNDGAAPMQTAASQSLTMATRPSSTRSTSVVEGIKNGDYLITPGIQRLGNISAEHEARVAAANTSMLVAHANPGPYGPPGNVGHHVQHNGAHIHVPGAAVVDVLTTTFVNPAGLVDSAAEAPASAEMGLGDSATLTEALNPATGSTSASFGPNNATYQAVQTVATMEASESTFPHDALFDPRGQYDLSFDPGAGDAFDAYDIMAEGTYDPSELEFDFNDLLNEDLL